MVLRCVTHGEKPTTGREVAVDQPISATNPSTMSSGHRLKPRCMLDDTSQARFIRASYRLDHDLDFVDGEISQRLSRLLINNPIIHPIHPTIQQMTEHKNKCRELENEHGVSGPLAEHRCITPARDVSRVLDQRRKHGRTPEAVDRKSPKVYYTPPLDAYRVRKGPGHCSKNWLREKQDKIKLHCARSGWVGLPKAQARRDQPDRAERRKYRSREKLVFVNLEPKINREAKKRKEK